MAVIDQLSVSLVARTTQWSKGLGRARKDLSRFGQDVRSVAGGLGGVTAGLLGVGTVGGLAAFVKHQADAIETTAAFASRIDASTEGLVAWRYAAGQSEIEAGTFDAAMGQLVKRAQDAANGTGPAVDALRDLGIEAAAFTAMPMEQKLAVLADRFSQMTDSGRAAVDVVGLMGRGGQPMLQLFNQGPAAIKQLTDRAAQLGLTFSKLDAANVDEGNDALGDLQKLAEGAANSVAISLAPTIEGLANHFVEAASQGWSLGDAIVGGMENAAVAISKVVNLVSLLQGTWYGFQGVVLQVGSWIVSAFQKAGAAVDWLMQKIPGMKPSAANQKQFAHEQGALKSVAAEMAAAASKSFDKAQTKLFDFATGTDGAAVRQFFADVKSKALEASEAVKAAPMGMLPEAISHGKMKSDPFAARSVNLADVFIGALGGQGSKKQAVHDPQLVETNEILRAIKRNLRGPVAQ